MRLDYLIFNLYDRKNIIEQIGELRMNKKIFLSACVTCILGLFGCAQTQPEYFECTGPNCQNPDDFVCQEGGDPSLCPKDHFINYTRTAADFREYGERAPQDYLISQAAEGNNMAATIPPSIEDEVIYYEQHIEKVTAEPEPVEEVVPEPERKPVAKPKAKKPVVPEAKPAEPVVPASTKPVVPVIANPVVPMMPMATQPMMAQPPVVAQIPAPVVANNQPVNVETPQVENVAEEEVEEVIEEVVEEDIEYVDDDLLDVEVTEEVSEAVEDEDTDDVEDPVQDWLAEEGQNLKALLTEWSEMSGWRLVWNSNRNYVLSAGAMFRGRFADVSSALIRAFARARPAPIATFYKGNRVLVVETMEDENAYE